MASLALFGFMHSYAWLDKVGKGQEDGVAKKKRVMTSWGGPLILFLVLVTFAQQWRAEPGSFSFAVGFKDSSGRTVSIEKGSVMFIMENAQETRVIDKDGRAVFSGIPKSYQGKEVTVRLNAAGWRLEKGETVSCRLTGNRVVLIVKKE
ncbi:MAG: hypothetical protein GY940_34230 [bacterium]|nr:hypothetical protein [bacterium]